MGSIRLFTACLLLFAALSVSCSNPEKDKQAHYKNALEFIEQDKQQAAILELRSAIQIDAKYGEARYQLGLLYLKEGENQKALEELIRAADLLPDNLDANLKVAIFQLLSGDRRECRKRLEHILAKDPNHQDALVFLANLELAEGNKDKALEALEKLGAEKLDASGDLQNLKGRIHVAREQWVEAEASFQKAIALDGENFEHYKTLLLHYETRNEKDKFTKLLEETAAKFPDNADAHLLQAGYHRSRGDFDKAGDELRRVVELRPDNPGYRLKLADHYESSGQDAQAEEILKKARAEIAGKPEITAALSGFYLDRGRLDDARSLFDTLKTENPQAGETQLLQARFHLKEGKAKDALDILQPLTKNYPQWPDPLFYLGIAHQRLGEIDAAQQAAAAAIQKNKRNYRYHLLMAQLLLTQGLFDEAKKEAATALQLNPKNLNAALILSRTLIGLKEFGPAVTILTDMRKVVPDSVEILSHLALASLGAGDRKNGEQTLRDVLEIDPGHAETVNLLINLTHKGDPSGAEKFVRQQISKAPQDHRLYLLLGGLLEEQKKDQESLAAYDKAQELSPDSAEPLLASARLLRRLGKNSEAMDKCTLLSEKNPKSIPGKMCVAGLYVEEGRAEKAIEHYKKVLEIKKDYAPAANNLAWLIASTPGGDLGEALMLAMTAKQALPDDPRVADTLGWVHYQRGSYPLAIAQFELALQHRLADPATAYHLAMAQAANNQKEKAVQTLNKLLESKEAFAEREKAEALLQEIGK